MQHPDMAYAIVSSQQAERQEKARLRRLLKAATAGSTDANDETGRPRPPWLENLDRCVEEPAPEVVVVIDLQGAVVRRPDDVGAATRGH